MSKFSVIFIFIILMLCLLFSPAGADLMLDASDFASVSDALADAKIRVFLCLVREVSDTALKDLHILLAADINRDGISPAFRMSHLA